MTALCCFLLGRLLFLLRDCIGELVSAMVDSPEGTDKDKKIKLSHGLKLSSAKRGSSSITKFEIWFPVFKIFMVIQYTLGTW